MISGFGQLLTTSGVELDEQSRQEINAGVIENTTNRKAVTRILGLLMENAELIFERFVQLDDYRVGTGVGLSLARSLSRSLGGDVVLDTSYTFGARFILSLPLTSTKQ